MSNEILLSIQNLCKSFKKPSNEGSLVILDDLCLEVPMSTTISIVGKSGSGKSTLLQIAGLLESPSSGNISFNGQSVLKLSQEQKAKIRNKDIGFIFQSNLLLEDFNALENVMVPALISGKSTKDSKDRAMSLLEEVGLKDRWNHYPRLLSGGENQRIAICRALMNEPKLILADEPTGALDEGNAQICENLLLEMAVKENHSLLMVTHDMDFAYKAQIVYQLVHGKLEEIKS